MEYSEAAKIATRQEWMTLGFYYISNDDNKIWTFVGSRWGLAQFVSLLRAYIANPSSKKLSEHQHYGPYMYLKVTTSRYPSIDKYGINGQCADIDRLANIIEQKLSQITPGETFVISSEYIPDCEYSLVFEAKNDGFNPASADPQL